MASKTNLEMPFKNASDKITTFVMANPKAGLQLTEVAATQALFISSNVFSTTGGDLVSALPPRVVTTATNVLV